MGKQVHQREDVYFCMVVILNLNACHCGQVPRKILGHEIKAVF